MDHGKRSRSQYLIVSLLLGVILLRLPTALGHFLSNLAWLQLSIVTNYGQEGEVQATEAIRLFQKAIAVDATNERAFLGMGMTYGVIGDEAAAIDSWQEARTTEDVLTGIADSFLVNELYDEALIYYKGASELSLVRPSAASFLAANVCQRNFEQVNVLNDSNQIFCQEYFAQNEDNLVVNGQFGRGFLSGWSERYFSGPTSAIYAIDETTGYPPAAVTLVGLTEAYHGGLFQTIALAAGVEVRYSAWFRIQREDEISVRLLYIGGQQDGQAFGSALNIVNEDMEWTYLERTVQLPQVDNMLYTFFPALLTGKGTVWIDDVRLEILPEE